MVAVATDNPSAAPDVDLSDADREQVQVVFVTTDPARDDEQVLRRYLDRLDPDFEGLTGDLDDIVARREALLADYQDAAYAARYVAKALVAAGLARKAEVQLSYAIGYPEPLNIWVNTNKTAKVAEERLIELIRSHFELTPKGIIGTLDLRRPIYRETARNGHFGRERAEFSWEKTDKAEALKKACS